MFPDYTPKEQPVAKAAAAEETTKTDDAPEQTEPKKCSGKLKLILLALPVVLLGVGAGLWFTGILPHMLARLIHEHSRDSLADVV
jgi:hypothetical protein